MESHVLNSFHQVKYRLPPIDRAATRACSTDSGHHTSPEYNQVAFAQNNSYTHKDSLYNTKNAVKWKSDDSQQKMAENNDSSESDEEDDNTDPNKSSDSESIEVESCNENGAHNYYYNTEQCEENSGDEIEISIGNQPFLEVYAIDPNAQLSSDEDENDDSSENEDSFENEQSEEDAVNKKSLSNIQEYNLDSHVVSHIDEYFVTNKTDNNNIVDDNVVKDLNEYFINDNKIIKSENPNDGYFDNGFNNTPKLAYKEPKIESVEVTSKVENFSQPKESFKINDPEILPHIENIKRFLLEGMPGTKPGSKSVQRSSSLPHSPAHLTNLPISDVKTSLSFEDLNLSELNDFPFDITTKSESPNKNDEPKILTEDDINGFFVGTKPINVNEKNNKDDFTSQDMEIECPIKSKIQYPSTVVKVKVEPEEPIIKPKTASSTILGFCKEKQAYEFTKCAISKQVKVKIENDDDDVDVESIADNTIIPVLEANNVNSLLEQFEATEQLNKNVKKEEASQKIKTINSPLNGTRLQVAAVHLSKTKLRQIKMSATPKTAVTPKSEKNVHSDHDYCSPEKRRHPAVNIKAGQSLLKPEVLSSNTKILNSRHRSCKDKKIVYSVSSDEEIDVPQKSKSSGKSVKNELHPNHRKKHLPTSGGTSSLSSTPKSALSVISKNASKASDNDSQSSSGSIKLTIKNKSKVILKLDCDDKKDSHVVNSNNKKLIVKGNSSDFNNYERNSEKTQSVGENKSKLSKPVNILKKPDEARPNNADEHTSKKAKLNTDLSKREIMGESKTKNQEIPQKYEEASSNKEDFYFNLFNNKDDVQLPQIDTKLQALDPKLSPTDFDVKQEPIEVKQPPKKKLNLQEYKMRKESSKRTVSPESIFDLDKSKMTRIQPTPRTNTSPVQIKTEDAPLKIFDPITEASRKILLNTQKQMAKRQRYEDIVMTKIPKVESLELQPLISDAEMLKMVDNGVIPKESLPIPQPIEKPRNSDYEEIILVSMGTNTNQKILRLLEKEMEKANLISSSESNKSSINFKIKPADKVIKPNVFDSNRDKIIYNENKPKMRHSTSNDKKMNKDRFKDITATIKSVEKNSDVKISSNSLFASIQDVIMKKEKALDENSLIEEKRKSNYSNERNSPLTNIRTKVNIVREYDPKEEHGEDKVILHLEKKRTKPETSTISVQTDETAEFGPIKFHTQYSPKSKIRSKTDSESSSNSCNNNKRICLDSKRRSLSRPDSRLDQRRNDRVKQSRSRDRYKNRSYRSRSRSLVNRSRNRSYRSRSISRYRRNYYKRSTSPYRKSRRSRSPYRKSSNRFHNRSRSHSRKMERSRSPVVKKLASPEKVKDKMSPVYKADSPPRTPPLRKPTISESSDSSSDSSSSSSSSSSSASSTRSCTKRRRSLSPDQHRQRAPNRCKSSFSSEDREGDTPVVERRIVFVGKLDKDTGKSKLRAQFSKFGYITNVTLHVKGDGTRYGFVTFEKAREAFMAVGAAASFPQYDVGFGGRRAFCREKYADLDEEKCYMPDSLPRDKNVSFEEMLSDIKNKLIKRNKKTDG